MGYAVEQAALLKHWKPETVLVMRALQVGDMLCAVPALRALRQHVPQAHVTLLGLPWARDLVRRYPELLQDFIEFPGHPLLPERPASVDGWPDFVAAMRARRFDLAIQLHGSGTHSNAIVESFGARHVAGFYPAGQPAPGPGFLPWPERGSEIDRLLALSEFLGAPVDDDGLDFPLLQEDRDELHFSGLAQGLQPCGYICLHPGARDVRRRWPVEQFARLADGLHRRWQLPLVFTGSGAETELVADIMRRIEAPAVNAAADVSLGALAVLLNASCLLICNDTGVSHLAAALALPSVVIFRHSEMERWRPLDQARHRCVADPEGVRLDDVMQQAELLLRAVRTVAAPAGRVPDAGCVQASSPP